MCMEARKVTFMNKEGQVHDKGSSEECDTHTLSEGGSVSRSLSFVHEK